MKKTVFCLLLAALVFSGCVGQKTEEKATTTTKATIEEPVCKTLWWFDDEHTDECRDKEFCGAYMYQGLRTYETEEECIAALPTTTTTTIFLRSGLGLGQECIANAECTSRCCVYLEGKKTCMETEECRRTLNQQECLARQMYWCAASCQKNTCGDCGKYMRCLAVQENGTSAVKVEVAEETEAEGSCAYKGGYRDAGGTGSYCDKNEGRLVYAKCGGTVSFEDCRAAYNETGNGTYYVQQKRSFHAPDGEAYDLWCFACARAV